jgi:hypothetical protein
MTVEVGPVSIGCCTAAVYTKMHWAVQTALDYIDCRNTGLANGAVGIDASVQFFSKIGTVDYPRCARPCYDLFRSSRHTL